MVVSTNSISVKAQIMGGHESLPDLVEAVSSGYALKFGAVKRVKTDIESFNARFLNQVNVFFQGDAVGGKGYVAEALYITKCF